MEMQKNLNRATRVLFKSGMTVLALANTGPIANFERLDLSLFGALSPFIPTQLALSLAKMVLLDFGKSEHCICSCLALCYRI